MTPASFLLASLLLAAQPLAGCVVRSQELYDPSSEEQEEHEEARESPEQDLSYLAARRRELLKAFQVRVGVGPGLGARIAATKLLQAGCLYLGPSEPLGEILKLKTLYAGNTGAEVGLWDVRSSEYGLSVFYAYEEEVLGHPDPAAPWHGSYEDRSATALEAGAHLGLLGAQVSFDPRAFLRFCAGLVGLGD